MSGYACPWRGCGITISTPKSEWHLYAVIWPSREAHTARSLGEMPSAPERSHSARLRLRRALVPSHLSGAVARTPASTPPHQDWGTSLGDASRTESAEYRSMTGDGSCQACGNSDASVAIASMAMMVLQMPRHHRSHASPMARQTGTWDHSSEVQTS